MRNAVKLLVTDVDRTLLTTSYVLPERVVAEVRRARESGIMIVLASARSPAGLRQYADRLGVTDLAICFNGGWVGDLRSGEVISRQSLDRKSALEIMLTAYNLDLNPMWYGQDGVFVLARNYVVEREAAITEERLVAVSDPSLLPEAPGKIMCVKPGQLETIKFDHLRGRFGSTHSVVGSHPRLLEIGPRGVSKQKAIAMVAKRLGLTAQNCAAAGDAENDLAMLRWAAISITVADAEPAVRASADFIGPICDEGGLAEGIVWLMGLIQERTLGTAPAS